MASISSYGVAVEGRITAGDMVLELPFDICEQARRADAEQTRLEPFASQLFLHQELVVEHVFCRRYPPGWLEADLVAGTFMVGPDHPQHCERNRQRRVNAFLAGGGLDEISPRHHADQRCPGDVAQRFEIARRQDGLEMGVATGRTKVLYLAVESTPITDKHVFACDDDVDFPSAVVHRGFNLPQLEIVRHKASRKSGRDRSNRDIRAFERFD